MIMKLFIALALVGVLLMGSCGGGNPVEKEYQRIRDGGLRGEELVAALDEFELRNPGHFDSKVDLGIFYLARGETGRAKDYLRRAELSLPSRLNGREGYYQNIPVMYGALGRLYLDQGNYQSALEYTDKALAVSSDVATQRTYGFLKGHILIAREEYPKALGVFETLFTSGVEAETEDLRAYLFLLAEAERPKDAAAVLDRYFETGSFFPGMGSFASIVYRAAGEIEKSSCAAYLEDEYRSGYRQPEASPMSPNGSATPLFPDLDFFAVEYLALKTLIENRSITEEDFRRYGALEPYFRLFPSFYWNLWQGACFLYPQTYQNFVPALQKIIALDREGPFARKAWTELTRFMGYEEWER
jgi:tetratricopeptide (TPR) repeat protein